MTTKTSKSTPSRKISKREYKYLLVHLAQLLCLAPNSIFRPKDIAKPIIKASVDNKFIESVCNHLRRKGVNIPTGNNVFYHLAGKNLRMSDIYTHIDSMIKRSFIKARRYINTRVPLCIGIDYHNVPYYGKGDKELTRWIHGCKNVRGTNKAFKFITAHIVVKGRRFTIAAIPVSVFDNPPDLLERIISNVRKYVRIKYAFLDRGFYAVNDIKKLIELCVGFVIPIIKYEGKKEHKQILQLMRKNYLEGNYRFKYTLGDKYNNVTFTVVVKKDEDVVGFATNTKLRAKTIGEWYGKRWGIETGYRVKEEFRSRTCSISSVVRLLFNMLSFVVYNLWVLVNINLRYTIGRGRFLSNNKSYMTAYELCKEIEDLIMGIP
jgi:hypothetical protein